MYRDRDKQLNNPLKVLIFEGKFFHLTKYKKICLRNIKFFSKNIAHIFFQKE